MTVSIRRQRPFIRTATAAWAAEAPIAGSALKGGLTRPEKERDRGELAVLAVPLQQHVQHLAQAGLIVDDEYPRAHCG